MNLLHTGVRLGNFSGTLIPLEMGMSARGCVIAPCSRMLDSNEAKKKNGQVRQSAAVQGWAGEAVLLHVGQELLLQVPPAGVAGSGFGKNICPSI